MKTFLEKIARQAGRMSLQYLKRLDEISVTVKPGTDKEVITEADHAIERFLTAAILERFPDHAILGEEQGSRAGNNFRWVIDPIDGTSSFARHQPFYSISIAVEKDGLPILAAVNAPLLDEFFIAEKAHGAYLNGQRITVSQRQRLIDCTLATGFACVRAGLSHNNLPYFSAIVPQLQGVRRYGSAAIDLSYVACGRLDGFWELNLRPYDVAAGLLIVAEAGGSSSDFSGETAAMPSEVLATNSHIHQQMVNRLTAVKNTLI